MGYTPYETTWHQVRDICYSYGTKVCVAIESQGEQDYLAFLARREGKIPLIFLF